MDIKIIISMFEDLKKLTSEQFGNLSKLIESKIQSSQQSNSTIQQVDLSKLESETAQTNALIKNEFKKSHQRIDELYQKLEEQKRVPLPPQKHLHPIELQSSKTVFVLVSLSTFLLCSLIGNISQFSENSRLNDNDIKFRYIKAMGEIAPNNLLQLENIFEYNPDKQKQYSLRKMVEEHERVVKQKAKELEEARLKEVQSEELRKEEEQNKQKK